MYSIVLTWEHFEIVCSWHFQFHVFRSEWSQFDDGCLGKILMNVLWMRKLRMTMNHCKPLVLSHFLMSFEKVTMVETFPVSFWTLAGELSFQDSWICASYSQILHWAEWERHGKQAWPTHLTLQRGADMKLRNKARETVCLREDDLL